MIDAESACVAQESVMSVSTVTPAFQSAGMAALSDCTQAVVPSLLLTRNLTLSRPHGGLDKSHTAPYALLIDIHF